MAEAAYADDDYGFDNERGAPLAPRNPMPDMVDEPEEWQARNSQLFAAWVEWRGRMLEHQARRRRSKPPAGWWARNHRRFSDACLREYGAEVPEPAFLAWRRRRLEELGRGHEELERDPWA